MKIKIIKTSASPDGIYQADHIYEIGSDLTEDVAASLIENQAAESFDSAVSEVEANMEDSSSLKHLGGGWYELPSGEKIKGKEEALKALSEEE